MKPLIGDYTYIDDLPSMAFGFDINNYGNASELMFMLDLEEICETEKDEILIVRKLPPGHWSIVGWSDEIEEGDAYKIIIELLNYKILSISETFIENTKTLKRYLSSKSIETRVLILKKEK